MIIKLKAGAKVHLNRDFNRPSVSYTKGGEAAEMHSGIMCRDGSIIECQGDGDAQLLNGEFKDYWICPLSSQWVEISPLELLAMEAE